MSSYTNPPQLTRISKRLWRVDVGFEYYVGHKGSAYVVKVADGTVTDLASIPRVLQWLLPPDGQYHSRFARWILRLFGRDGWDWGYAHAAIAHDELYRLGIATKFIADVVFYEAMTTSQVYKWLRLIMYLAVRIGGKGSYEKRDGDGEVVGATTPTR